jgi:cysteine desulfurase / selenocysteine lyase
MSPSLKLKPSFRTALDPALLKREFPVFEQHPRLVFLDTAASAQKPHAVIDGIANFYRQDYANVHRGAYDLSVRATERFEAARETARRFLNAAHVSEIVFVRGDRRNQPRCARVGRRIPECWRPSDPDGT